MLLFVDILSLFLYVLLFDCSAQCSGGGGGLITLLDRFRFCVVLKVNVVMSCIFFI